MLKFDYTRGREYIYIWSIADTQDQPNKWRNMLQLLRCPSDAMQTELIWMEQNMHIRQQASSSRQNYALLS